LAKKCRFEKQKRSKELIERYAELRSELVTKIKNPETPQHERIDCYRKLLRLPRNSAQTRFRKRCVLTGRPRAYMGKFQLCRNKFRELALEGKLPGVTKSSW
jgi:small subunit ribosomal protein S14